MNSLLVQPQWSHVDNPFVSVLKLSETLQHDEHKYIINIMNKKKLIKIGESDKIEFEELKTEKFDNF